MTSRRQFLAGLAALPLAATPLAAFAQATRRPLAMPPLMDARESRAFGLTAQAGTTDFLGRGGGTTRGLNGAYLGPTLRLATGQVSRAEVRNALDEVITLHWHGLLVPGEADGGPHQPIAPGASWVTDLPITQPACTAWYHAHTHGETARQVQMGLAGVLQVDDGQDDARGLPSDYGIDDLMLVLQDRRFDRRGRIDYDPAMPDRMMGFLGDTMVVNGQVGATAVVPRGIVRLRLLNGSNARIYPLGFEDGREMHLVATDSGFLDRPIALNRLTLAPGERAEILVDFSDGRDARLVSGPNPNRMMGGMMGGGSAERAFPVLPFAVDSGLPARIARLPQDLGGSVPARDAGDAAPRRISLEMPMGPGMMLGMLLGGSVFSINGQSFDMGRTDFTIARGSTERWRITADTMMHPLHIHGVRFAVLSENGHAPAAQNLGWKDTVLVNGQAELLVRFDHPAPPETPFMFHCHILEHEDGGMMGQFAVT
ncbi:MAG: cell division protein FtsP [Paracoccaceae bacterium]|nr:MAG: cell division protein FtsP [Paracoccaceae bacterium]